MKNFKKNILASLRVLTLCGSTALASPSEEVLQKSLNLLDSRIEYAQQKEMIELQRIGKFRSAEISARSQTLYLNAASFVAAGTASIAAKALEAFHAYRLMETQGRIAFLILTNPEVETLIPAAEGFVRIWSHLSNIAKIAALTEYAQISMLSLDLASGRTSAESERYGQKLKEMSEDELFQSMVSMQISAINGMASQLFDKANADYVEATNEKFGFWRSTWDFVTLGGATADYFDFATIAPENAAAIYKAQAEELKKIRNAVRVVVGEVQSSAM